ncbi:hypothetical protein DNG35_01680 [Mesonia sp. K7]|nr:hypothetical protein DNG35_01680 [Mesonia sp. K7]
MPFIFNCNGTKKVTENARPLSENLKPLSECWKNAVCTFEVMENTTMTIDRDDANILYPKFEKKEGVKVIKYRAAENEDKMHVDGHYIEEILFEVGNEVTELNLTDADLASVKMLFGRHCFCKGAAGYFEVRKGSLVMKDGKLTIDIQNEQVPQRLEIVTGAF